MVIAYLLEGPIKKLTRGLRIPRLGAVVLVFTFFLIFAILIIFVLLPYIGTEFGKIAATVPSWPGQLRETLVELPDKYPKYVSTNMIDGVVSWFDESALEEKFKDAPATIAGWLPTGVKWTRWAVNFGVYFLIYTILMPILVFFFLKDKKRITEWFSQFIPRDHALVDHVWGDVDLQVSNYVRGKFVEILIVWAVSFVVFSALDLNYAMVLSLFTGLSVLLPYVGATFMTLPVILVAMFQVTPDINPWYPILAYGIIQLLDGNLLAPLLLSNVTNIHPIGIIAAILVFGGIWGFWGVFFAIPLATVINAIIVAWPKSEDDLAAVPSAAPEIDLPETSKTEAIESIGPVTSISSPSE